MALDAILGLNWLHSQTSPIIHGGLTPENLLVRITSWHKTGFGNRTFKNLTRLQLSKVFFFGARNFVDLTLYSFDRWVKTWGSKSVTLGSIQSNNYVILKKILLPWNGPLLKKWEVKKLLKNQMSLVSAVVRPWSWSSPLYTSFFDTQRFCSIPMARLLRRKLVPPDPTSVLESGFWLILIVLYLLSTSKCPFQQFETKEDLFKAVTEGYRPNVSSLTIPAR